MKQGKVLERINFNPVNKIDYLNYYNYLGMVLYSLGLKTNLEHQKIYLLYFALA